MEPLPSPQIQLSLLIPEHYTRGALSEGSMEDDPLLQELLDLDEAVVRAGP